MKKSHAIQLWNASVGTSFGGDWGDVMQLNALGGAACAKGLTTSINFGAYDAKSRAAVSMWLREWADALVEGDIIP